MRSCRSGSLGLGEAHPVVVPVEDGVVLADEDVPQDPQGSSGGGDVQAHEATQTDGLPGLGDLGGPGTETEEVRDKQVPTQTELLCFLLNDATVVLLLPRQQPQRRPLLARTLRTYCSPVRL